MKYRSGCAESKESTTQSFAENVGATTFREQELLRKPLNKMKKKHSASEEHVRKAN